jgi:hypothetical protein
LTTICYFKHKPNQKEKFFKTMPEEIASVSGPEGGFKQVKYSTGPKHVYRLEDGKHIRTEDMLQSFGHSLDERDQYLRENAGLEADWQANQVNNEQNPTTPPAEEAQPEPNQPTELDPALQQEYENRLQEALAGTGLEPRYISDELRDNIAHAVRSQVTEENADGREYMNGLMDEYNQEVRVGGARDISFNEWHRQRRMRELANWRTNVRPYAGPDSPDYHPDHYQMLDKQRVTDPDVSTDDVRFFKLQEAQAAAERDRLAAEAATEELPTHQPGEVVEPEPEPEPEPQPEPEPEPEPIPGEEEEDEEEDDGSVVVPIPAPIPIPGPERPSERLRDRRRLARGLGIVAILAAVGGAAYLAVDNWPWLTKGADGFGNTPAKVIVDRPENHVKNDTVKAERFAGSGMVSHKELNEHHRFLAHGDFIDGVTNLLQRQHVVTEGMTPQVKAKLTKAMLEHAGKWKIAVGMKELSNGKKVQNVMTLKQAIERGYFRNHEASKKVSFVNTKELHKYMRYAKLFGISFNYEPGYGAATGLNA